MGGAPSVAVRLPLAPTGTFENSSGVPGVGVAPFTVTGGDDDGTVAVAPNVWLNVVPFTVPVTVSVPE